MNCVTITDKDMKRTFFLLSLIALITTLLGGCATMPPPTAFQPVSSERALVRWQRGGNTLTSDAVCARAADGSVLVRLYKQSPAPLLELRLDADGRLTARGSLTGRGWSGSYGEAPFPLATWVSFLLTWQNADSLPRGDREMHTAAARIAYRKTASGLQSLSVASLDTPETLSAIFRSENDVPR